MASLNLANNPAFLVFPTLSSQYLWKVVGRETNRTVSRHKQLALAIRKAERLNRCVVAPSMPAPQFAERFTSLASSVRGTCQLWYDYASDPGRAIECNRPASVTDSESGCSFCVQCWKEAM